MGQCKATHNIFCNGVHLITYFCRNDEGHEGAHIFEWYKEDSEEYIESDNLLRIKQGDPKERYPEDVFPNRATLKLLQVSDSPSGTCDNIIEEAKKEPTDEG